MMTKPRILFVLHLPPPMHGAALVGSFIRESGLVNSTFDTRYVNLSASSTLEEVGRFSLKKFRPVFRLIREDAPFFSLKLVYENDQLIQAVLNGEAVID